MLRKNTPEEKVLLRKIFKEKPNKLVYINYIENSYKSGWYKVKIGALNHDVINNMELFFTLKHPKVKKIRQYTLE